MSLRRFWLFGCAVSSWPCRLFSSLVSGGCSLVTVSRLPTGRRRSHCRLSLEVDLNDGYMGSTVPQDLALPFVPKSSADSFS